ncbi:MAG: VWA domain-containing protein [Fimbriimonadaceae bacterium]|nr:VWA domain-containing protein [Chitinophagales bacterium]
MQEYLENIKLYFQDIRFADPWYFLLLLLIPIYIWWHISSRRKKYVQLKMSRLGGIKNIAHSGRVKFFPLLFILRCLCISAVAIALARPQTGFSNAKISTMGIDMVIAMDISSSMYAIDIKPNRMKAAKETAIEFIDARKNDRIGMVVFAGETFTQCPITLDHELLKTQIENVDHWLLEDGTALGDGLFMAVTRLTDTTQLNTKVIILITDGVRTAGEFAPLDASEAAKQFNIRVYTIGIGSRTNQPVPVVDKNGRIMYELDPQSSFDETTMQQIADNTGGKYFRATTKESLSEIYKEIDAIEKQKVETTITKRYDEKFYPFAFAAILFLLIEIILANTLFRTVT